MSKKLKKILLLLPASSLRKCTCHTVVMNFSQPLLLGHRGSPRQARENTLESFGLALEAGLDGLELDIHRTRDGVLAIYHDFSLEGRPIATLDWADLQTAAPWMPRLEQVLELAESFPNCKLNLELKSLPRDSDGREMALAQMVNAWPHHQQAWISSFDPLALIRLYKIGIKVELALLYDNEEMLELLPCLKVQGLHPYQALLTQENTADFKAKGLFVATWTVNDPGRAKQLLQWGVDGLIGDDPLVLLSARS